MDNIWIRSRIKDPETEKNLLDAKVSEEDGQLKREDGEQSCPVGLWVMRWELRRVLFT